MVSVKVTVAIPLAGIYNSTWYQWFGWYVIAAPVLSVKFTPLTAKLPLVSTVKARVLDR